MTRSPLSLALALAFAISLAGCDSAENGDRQAKQGWVASAPGAARPMHHHPHQHGAFADAEKAAAKFNSPARNAWQHPDQIVASLNLREGATVADIGAGTGYMVASLSQAVGQSGVVVAVDAEDAMIAYLTNRIESLGPATIKPRKSLHDDPGLPNESVDAILILDTWHHIDSRTNYAKKLHAALKPQGTLVIVDAELEAEIGPPQDMRVAPEHVEQELSAAGFQVQIGSESMPRHYMVIAQKR